MPINQIHKTNNSHYYFLTMTICNWYHIFDRFNRWEILANSLKFFQENFTSRENEKFFLQKLKYIYDNPVRKGYVTRPENWKWSLANEESEIRCDLLL